MVSTCGIARANKGYYDRRLTSVQNSSGACIADIAFRLLVFHVAIAASSMDLMVLGASLNLPGSMA